MSGARFVLDAGALIALDRSDRFVWRLVEAARRGRIPLVTHGGVIARVVCSARQARLALALRAIEVVALDRDLGHTTGHLLGRSRTHDVVDAALVVVSRPGDTILTTDADAIEHLVACAGIDVTIVRV